MILFTGRNLNILICWKSVRLLYKHKECKSHSTLQGKYRTRWLHQAVPPPRSLQPAQTGCSLMRRQKSPVDGFMRVKGQYRAKLADGAELMDSSAQQFCAPFTYCCQLKTMYVQKKKKTKTVSLTTSFKIKSNFVEIKRTNYVWVEVNIPIFLNPFEEKTSLILQVI